jgi:hypothetical protein
VRTAVNCDYPEIPKDVNPETEYCLFLNPENHVLRGDEIAFFISSNLDIVETLATYAGAGNQDTSIVTMPEMYSSNSTDEDFSPKSMHTSEEHRPLLYSQKILQEPSTKDGIPSRRASSESVASLARPTNEGQELPSQSSPKAFRKFGSTSGLVRQRSSLNIITESQSHIQLSHHIVICDTSSSFPRNINCFIRVLRAKYLEQKVPIVILSSGHPSEYQLRTLMEFDEVTYQYCSG